MKSQSNEAFHKLNYAILLLLAYIRHEKFSHNYLQPQFSLTDKLTPLESAVKLLHELGEKAVFEKLASHSFTAEIFGRALYQASMCGNESRRNEDQFREMLEEFDIGINKQTLSEYSETAHKFLNFILKQSMKES